MTLEAPLPLGVFLASGGDPRSMLQGRFRLLCEEAVLIEGLTDVERQQWAAKHRVSAAFWRAQPFTVGQGGEPVEFALQEYAVLDAWTADLADGPPSLRRRVLSFIDDELEREQLLRELELEPARVHLEYGPDQDQTRSAVDPALGGTKGRAGAAADQR